MKKCFDLKKKFENALVIASDKRNSSRLDHIRTGGSLLFRIFMDRGFS
jgi:hypothetical protein